MTQLHKFLFPSLADRRWGYVNFGEESRLLDEDPKISDSEESLHWVNRLHARLGIEFSFGGYMEDRSFLMRNNYQKPGETWHLGIDYTVPVGTQVYLPMDATLESSIIDPDQNGGWGGKLIFRTARHFLIFGHMGNLVTETKGYKAGDAIGVIAPFDRNGGWFPHLHVQAVADHLDPEAVDGYGALYAGIDKDFPRPEKAESGEPTPEQEYWLW